MPLLNNCKTNCIMCWIITVSPIPCVELSVGLWQINTCWNWFYNCQGVVLCTQHWLSKILFTHSKDLVYTQQRSCLHTAKILFTHSKDLVYTQQRTDVLHSNKSTNRV